MRLKKSRQTDLQWHRLLQKATHCNTLCSDLNVYREIWISLFVRFPGCSIFSGICHMIVWMICCISSVSIKLMTVSTDNATSTLHPRHPPTRKTQIPRYLAGKIQIKPTSQFEFVSWDARDSEFQNRDSVNSGDVAFSVKPFLVCYMCWILCMLSDDICVHAMGIIYGLTQYMCTRYE